MPGLPMASAIFRSTKYWCNVVISTGRNFPARLTIMSLPRRVTDTPAEIRDEMADTRQALGDALGALKGRLFGTNRPATNEGGLIVAKASGKSTGGSAKKKAGAAKKAMTAKKITILIAILRG